MPTIPRRGSSGGVVTQSIEDFQLKPEDYIRQFKRSSAEEFLIALDDYLLKYGELLKLEQELKGTRGRMSQALKDIVEKNKKFGAALHVEGDGRHGFSFDHNGRSFRNAEYFAFVNGRISRISAEDVLRGRGVSPQTHSVLSNWSLTNWFHSDDTLAHEIEAVLTERRVMEPRFEISIRGAKPADDEFR